MKNFYLLISLLILSPIYSQTLSITTPESREILQRTTLDNSTTTNATFSGSYTGSVASIEIMATDLNENGNHVAWTTLDSTPTAGDFSGTLALNTGWYEISIRSVDATDTILNTEVIPFFGIGDVYITAGQSNGGNFGQVKQTSNSNQVSYYNTGNRTWTHAVDPSVSAASNGGSRGAPWPILGDLLVEKDNNTPVAFAMLNDGASNVNSWTPSANDNYPNLRTTLNKFGPHGFRAILWHQGERDRGNTTDRYVTSLNTVIASSRADAGWDIPWYVALVSSSDPTIYQQIVEGQLQVIRADDNVFLGSHTDDLINRNPATGLAWRPDGIHFGEDGLIEHAHRWIASIYRSDDVGPIETNTQTLENGEFQLSFLGVAGITYTLQKSLNLQDNCSVGATGNNTTTLLYGTNTATLIDTDPTNGGTIDKAFYSIGILE